MARPKLLCPSCSNELKPDSRFCSSCGTKIDWEGAETGTSAPPTPVPRATGGPIKCPLCGFENGAGIADCESCGAALPGAAKAGVSAQPGKSNAAPSAKTGSTGNAVLEALQSWKLIVVVAVILIAVLVGSEFFKSTKPAAPQQNAPAGQMGSGMGGQQGNPQNTAAIAAQIDALQKQADENPADAQARLHLANALQDARVPDRAIDAYKKYLEMKPDDANAIVDLGVCYYELAGADSTTRSANLVTAREHFEKALGMEPRHQMAMFNLGIVSLMTGDLHVATQWFKKTVSVDSTSDVGKRALTLLTQHSFENK